jgi:hypothetical protein
LWAQSHKRLRSLYTNLFFERTLCEAGYSYFNCNTRAFYNCLDYFCKKFSTSLK